MSQPETFDQADLYLASQSPRRRELLAQIGVKAAVVRVDVEEAHQPGELPAQYVQRLALDKATAGSIRLTDAGVAGNPTCLGSDTIVVLDNRILEKPDNAEHGRQMLLDLADSWHQVMTAVALVQGERQQVRLSVTDVQFRPISADEAERYWRTGEPADKAGGYGIQGLGAVFVRSLRGSYSGVVGLPLYETQDLLRAFDVPVWQI